MPVRPNGDQDRVFSGARLSGAGRTAGMMLHERRLDYGWDIDDIAASLKIKPEYLRALENDEVGALPGPAYAVGFMRAYGDFLGFDGKEIASLFKQQKAVVARTPALSYPIPLTERGIPGSSLIMVALIIFVLGYGAWAWYSSTPRTSLAAVQPVPTRLLPPADIDPPTVSPESAAAAELRQTTAAPASPTPLLAPPPATMALPLAASSAPPSGGAVTISRAGQTTNQPLAAPATAASVPGEQVASLSTDPADVPHVFGSTVPGQVVVKATADSWVEVLDDGHQIWTRTLKPGDLYYPPKDGLVMRTGNAGGLEISVDGHMLPPVGASGEVKRIALDAAKLQGG